MKNLENAVAAFKKLNPSEVNIVIRRLLKEEKIDIPVLVALHAQYLQEFRTNALQDMQKLAEAGIDLGRKEISKIGSIKDERKKQLVTAQANTLLQQGFRGTKLHDKLSAHVDMSIVDKDWYDWSWALKATGLSSEPQTSQRASSKKGKHHE